jgi:hypothetical protein
LTTFTDHRHTPLGKTRAVRTAGKGSDQSITRSLAARGRYSLARERSCLIRQKGARRPPAKTEKTLSPPPGLAPGTSGKPNAGGRGSCEACHRGGYRDAGLQNLLLNLYSLVKERLISQAPPNAGESAVRRNSRRTRSSSARCFDHRPSGDLSCFREPELAGRDERQLSDQTCLTSLALTIRVTDIESSSPRPSLACDVWRRQQR